MLDLWQSLATTLSRGENALLLLVLETTGSVPRGVGAALALSPDGTAVGTVGGGAIERIALERGKTLLARGESARDRYTLSGGELSNTGMICGGTAQVGFALLSHQDPATLAAAEKALSACRGGLPLWATLEWAEGEPATLAVTAKGEGPWAGLLQSRPASGLEEGVTRYAQPLSAGRCFVFGGGHVGRALVPILAAAGFRPTVVDDRPQVALPEYFPQAEAVLVGDFDHMVETLDIQSRDCVLIMTHGHRSDLTLLAQVLKTQAAFIGCLGSEAKAATVRGRLAEMGFSPEDIRRIHSPVGLPIGGETPAEIGVSVAAQLIQIRTELAGGRRRGAV